MSIPDMSDDTGVEKDEKYYQKRLLSSCGHQQKWIEELNPLFSWEDIDLVKETQDLRKDMAKHIMDLKTSIADDDRKKDHEFRRTKNTLCRILTKLSPFQITSIPVCSSSYVMRYDFEQVVDKETDKTQVCEIDKTTFYGLIIEYISIIEEVIYSYPREVRTTRDNVEGTSDDDKASFASIEFTKALREQLESLDALKELMIKNQEINSQNIREEYSAYKDKIEPYVGEYTNQNSSMESTQPEWKDLMKTAKIRSKITEEYPRGVTPSVSEYENLYKNSQENINTEVQTPTELESSPDIDESEREAMKKKEKKRYMEYLMSQVGLDRESISRLKGREKDRATKERQEFIDDIVESTQAKKKLSGKVRPITFSSELEKTIPSIISSKKKDEEDQLTQHMLDDYSRERKAIKNEIVDGLENTRKRELKQGTFVGSVTEKEILELNKNLRERKKGGKKSKKKSKKPRKWSTKYKRSIDCSKPKGFSQKQYCKYGRKSKKSKSKPLKRKKKTTLKRNRKSKK